MVLLLCSANDINFVNVYVVGARVCANTVYITFNQMLLFDLKSIIIVVVWIYVNVCGTMAVEMLIYC